MKAFRSEPKPTDKKKVMAVATPRETYQQENRMAKISNLEGRIRKHRVLENAHKTIVSDLYSHGKKDKVKLPPISKPAIVLVSSQSLEEEGDSEDYTAEEDESNREKYFGRKLSDQDGREIDAKTTSDGKPSTDNLINFGTDQINMAGASSALIIPSMSSFGQHKTTERRGSASDNLVESSIDRSDKRRPSQTDLIFETWKADFQTNDADRASSANLIKTPDQKRRKSFETPSSTTRLSPIHLMNKSTEAINVLKDVLCPIDGNPATERRPSPEGRRPSLYMMSKSETDIWRHCLRIDRNPTLSFTEVDMEELKKCRYLRLPSDYQ